MIYHIVGFETTCRKYLRELFFDEKGSLKPNEEDFVPDENGYVVRRIMFQTSGVKKERGVDYRYQLIVSKGTRKKTGAIYHDAFTYTLTTHLSRAQIANITVSVRLY